MKRITYVIKKDLVAILKNSGVPLAYGDLRFTDSRWVVSLDVFEDLKKQNPDVEFVSDAGG